MSMQSYTDMDAVAKLLRDGVRVVLSQDEPTGTNGVDMSYSNAEAYRTAVEAEITQRLGRFYSVPLAMSNIGTIEILKSVATYLTGVKVWLALHPTMTIDRLPAAVLEWRDSAEKMLGRIVPEGKQYPVDGRDIILDGETLRTSAGNAGTVAAYTTRLMGYGGEL